MKAQPGRAVSNEEILSQIRAISARLGKASLSGADIVANSVQGMFFVAIAAGAYFWGEKHRKEGKFKS